MKVLSEEYYKDRYSYGLLVWQIAKNGDIPFEGMDEREIEDLKHTDKTLSCLMKDLDDEIDEVPEEVKSVIAVMTCYNPQERGSLADVRKIMKIDDGYVYCSQ